jgi:hypothetical protein
MFDALRSTNFVTLSGKVEQVLSTHMVVIDGSVWMSHTTSHIVLKGASNNPVVYIEQLCGRSFKFEDI